MKNLFKKSSGKSFDKSDKDNPDVFDVTIAVSFKKGIILFVLF